MTHTEHVHLLFGIGLTLTGALWLGAQAYPAAPFRYMWPVLLAAVGLFLVIPTETQERTYVRVGVWDTFLSVFPNSLSVWLTTVQKAHVIQHKVTGVCAAVAVGATASDHRCRPGHRGAWRDPPASAARRRTSPSLGPGWGARAGRDGSRGRARPHSRASDLAMGAAGAGVGRGIGLGALVSTVLERAAALSDRPDQGSRQTRARAGALSRSSLRLSRWTTTSTTN